MNEGPFCLGSKFSKHTRKICELTLLRSLL